MAAPMKKMKTVDYDDKLSSFQQWLKIHRFFVNQKVRVSRDGSVNEIGMNALEDIDEDELLFTIPRDAILWQENCSIKNEIKEDMLASNVGWVPLIVAILYEYFNPESKWRPYLDLFPNYSTLDHPMFWESDFLLAEIGGTGIAELVRRDLDKMEKDYNEVALPFMKKHRKLFRNSAALEFEMYKKAVAFIMAYSFTDDDDEDDDGPRSSPAVPMIVPLADVLNHVTNHNAHVVYKEDRLEMRSVRSIKKNEEIFNTYGQLSNSELLHMYGFAELFPQNTGDVVCISLDVIVREFHKSGHEGDGASEDKTQYLNTLGVQSDDSVLIIGVDGLVDTENLCRTLKVLFDESFVAEELDDDNIYDDITTESLQQLPVEWLKLLCRSAVTKKSHFSRSLADDEATLNEPVMLNSLGRRQRWALYVRYGQQMLLKRFIKSASDLLQVDNLT